MDDYLNALPRSYRIDEYSLVRVLGAGGFGITYLGFDHHLEKAVAIKEYLPSDLAVRQDGTSVMPKSNADAPDFQWGLDRFLAEARTLAQFDHPNLVKVYRFFRANGTGYIVMEYVEGETLAEYLERRGQLDEAELRQLLEPILDGIEQVHAAGFLHRDVKPSNIVIREDGRPVLIDFGAARQALGVKSRSVTSIVTPGYAPIEQYTTTGEQGPWTDIYGLGAVCYRALTGATPVDATARVLQDPLQPATEAARERARPAFLAAVDRALAFDQTRRPQDVAAWRALLAGEGEAAATASAAPEPPAAAEPSPAGPGEGTVPSGETVTAGTSAGPAAAASPPRRRWWVGALALIALVAVGAALLLSLPAGGPATGTLTVETEPPGADIALEGLDRAYEPGVTLPAGRHELRISHEGYRARSYSLDIEPGSNRVALRLEPLPARLLVSSPVPGAHVRVAGRSVGPADGSPIELAPGEHEVEVVHADHEPFRTTVALAPGETVELSPNLVGADRTAEVPAAASAEAPEPDASGPDPEAEPAAAGAATAPARLVVRSNVSGDALYIDGRHVGPTGTTAHQVSPGRHQVEVRKPGHRAWRGSIDVAGGRTARVNATLARLPPRVGRIVVGANVADGRVLIDNVPVGTTGSAAHEVEPGTHEVAVSREGYEPWRQRVRVAAGETRRLSAVLTRQPERVGRLSIRSNVDRARLYVDGREMGIAGEDVLELAPGKYRIVLRKAGYLAWSEAVEVTAGEDRELEAELRRNSAQGRVGSIIDEADEEPDEAGSEYTGAQEEGVPFAPQKQ